MHGAHTGIQTDDPAEKLYSAWRRPGGPFFLLPNLLTVKMMLGSKNTKKYKKHDAGNLGPDRKADHVADLISASRCFASSSSKRSDLHCVRGDDCEEKGRQMLAYARLPAPMAA